MGAGLFVILYFLARTKPYGVMMFAVGVTSLALLGRILFWVVIAPRYFPDWHPDWWFVLSVVLLVMFAAVFSIAFAAARRERAIARDKVGDT